MDGKSKIRENTLHFPPLRFDGWSHHEHRTKIKINARLRLPRQILHRRSKLTLRSKSNLYIHHLESIQLTYRLCGASWTAGNWPSCRTGERPSYDRRTSTGPRPGRRCAGATKRPPCTWPRASGCARPPRSTGWPTAFPSPPWTRCTCRPSGTLCNRRENAAAAHGDNNK